MTNSQFFSNCTADSIREAAAALKAGHLVAFPTETVYGLGADARNPEAVKRIYEVKGRPSDHPLIVHISSINQLEKWATEIPEYAIDLARAFWPGPMTLILKRTEIAQDFITGGQETVGLRVPSDPIALALIQEFEKISDSAIAAPSANRFGCVSPTSANDVKVEIGNFLEAGDLILDGGFSDIGIESTIIDARNRAPRILRPGAVTEAMINGVVELKTFHEQLETSIRVSGSLKSHYAPKAKVIINQIPKPGQAFIALKIVNTPQGVHRIAAPRSIEEFARCLYSGMREADNLGYIELVIEIPLGPGLASAILDRATKSANSAGI
jgi:L-threonylcarbamoyladenylate synthase